MVLNDSIEYVGDNGLQGFIGDIYIPKNIKHLGKGSFTACGNIYFEEGIETILEAAFTGIQSVKYPGTLKYIEASAFAGSDLKIVDIRFKKNKKQAFDGIMPQKIFIEGDSLIIEDFAFYSHGGITSNANSEIYIGKGVVSIGNGCFEVYKTRNNFKVDLSDATDLMFIGKNAFMSFCYSPYITLPSKTSVLNQTKVCLSLLTR